MRQKFHKEMRRITFIVIHYEMILVRIMNTANSMILYSKEKNCPDTGLLRSILRGGRLAMTGGGGLKIFSA